MRGSQFFDRALVLELDGKHKQGKEIIKLLAIEKMIKTHVSIRFAIKSNN